MITLEETLQRVRARGIQLSADGDRVKCRAPNGSLTPDILEGLKAHKDEILCLLGGTSERVKPRTSGGLSIADATVKVDTSRTGDKAGANDELRSEDDFPAVLEPYRPLIIAARQRLLWSVPPRFDQQSSMSDDYVLRISTILANETGDAETRHDHMQILHHLTDIWNEVQGLCIYCVQRPAIYPLASNKVPPDAQTICGECWEARENLRKSNTDGVHEQAAEADSTTRLQEG